MNKKLIHGLLFVALMIGTLGTVSSCKDTDEDIRAELLGNQLTIQQLLDSKIALLQARLDSCKNACKIAHEELNKKINGKADTATVNALALQLATLEAWKMQLDTATSAYGTKGVLNRLVYIENLIGKLGLDANGKYKDLTLPEIFQKAIDAYSTANANKVALDSIINNYDLKGMDSRIKSLEEFKKKAEANKLKTDSILEKLENGLVTLDAKVDSINDRLSFRIDSLGDEINDLKVRVSTLENRFNAMVTSVLVQGVENPIFGSLALPINVQSNILLSYYAPVEVDDYNFPSNTAFSAYNGNSPYTEADLAVIRTAKTFAVENGSIFKSPNAGRVYMTVNPNNVDFDGKTVKLVNSLDQEGGITLKNLQKSTKLLTFGYTRTTTFGNAFYEAEAELVDPQAAKINIDDNLKSAMKSALENHTKQDFVQVIKAIYDQFNGLLPAYGIKAEWTPVGSDTTYATYSNYNIAATAFKPLSFKFLYGKHINKKFPVIDPITIPNIDINKYIDFSDITVPAIKIDDIDVTISFKDIKFDDLGTLYVNVEVPQTKDGQIVVIKKYDENGVLIDIEIPTTIVPYEVDEEQIKNFADNLANQLGVKIEEQVKAALNNAMSDISGKVQKAIEDALNGENGVITQIQDKINDLNKKLNDQIRSNFGAYVDKLNNYIGKINNFTNAINNRLYDPNHYLQVTMLYEHAGSYHQLSNNPYVPTYMKLAGGNAITLFPTTYTAEIIAPAYKKYVAVTKVTGPDATVAAQLLADANAQNFMNEAVDGQRLTVPFKVSDKAAGYTYEIVYSALDYHGYTSTQKFYVRIVK